MNGLEEKKKKAIAELYLALKQLSEQDSLPLREKAMVLEAIDKIEKENS